MLATDDRKVKGKEQIGSSWDKECGELIPLIVANAATPNRRGA